MWQVGPISLHLYGLIVGISVVLAFHLAELKAKKVAIVESVFFQGVLWTLLGGVIGSRLWHVTTDRQLYSTDWWSAFYIWRGGLSIIGAVIGGLVSISIYYFFSKKTFPLGAFIDVVIFGLPFGQALGRVANYFNQELYGLPTALPWGIFIDVAHRLPGFEHEEYFHPLFAYEALGCVSFGLLVWWRDQQKPLPVGTGTLAMLYGWYYSLLRFGLDFLRPDKAIWSSTGLGLNQTVLLLVVVLLSWGLWQKRDEVKNLFWAA